jgi:hypothetical protein
MSVALKAVSITPEELVDRRIYVIRDQRVMLDRDLAELYGVKAIALRQQVKRNIDRFQKDFLFQLHARETQHLVSQNVIPDERSQGGFKPYAFTEQGVAMLSSVLTSKRALQVNIAIMRAFVRMREMLIDHQDLLRKIQDMELRYDDDAIRCPDGTAGSAATPDRVCTSRLARPLLVQEHVHSVLHGTCQRDLPRIHKEDLIHVVDRVQPVRDDHPGGRGRQFVQDLLE